MSKHTPGPWKVNADEYGNVLGVRATNDATICQINWMIRKRGGLQAEANARLIAAAPEMLEALRLVMSDDRLMNAMKREQARAILDAIAKAEGRE